jgi:hypothetical protein
VATICLSLGATRVTEQFTQLGNTEKECFGKVRTKAESIWSSGEQRPSLENISTEKAKRIFL